jgi:DNA-directed RNA polymerase subunit RPC12/RpoP
MNRKRVTIVSSSAKAVASDRERLGIVRTLIELNSLEVDVNKKSPEQASRLAALREKLPTQILMAHDGLVALGRCSLAPRILGKCNECSAKVKPATPLKSGIAGTLVLCPRCGVLLYG